MSDSVRTVVLAREGEARDRVIAGLAAAGAELAGTLDPSQHGPEALQALAPTVLLVVLEPATEDALEPFEPIFESPGLTVMFEEAALVVGRSGWDEARWVRHVAAKLRGLADVLPPSDAVDEDEAAAVESAAGVASGVVSAAAPSVTPPVPEVPATRCPEDGLQAMPAVEPAHSVGEAVAVETQPVVVPQAPVAVELSGEPAFVSSAERETASELELEFEHPAEPDALAVEAPALAADAVQADMTRVDEAAVAMTAADADAEDGFSFELLDVSATPEPVEGHHPFDPVVAEFEAPPQVRAPTVNFSYAFQASEPVQPAAAVPLNDDSVFEQTPPSADAGEAVVEEVAAVPAELPESTSGEPLTLSLVDADDTGISTPAAVVETSNPAVLVQRDLEELDARISSLSLVEDEPEDAGNAGLAAGRGVVLVLGGLGGPDAVRQFLGALPDGFPRAVLVRLQLDGGRYDRLVRQMERATAAPVQLAEPGMDVLPGKIYFLPPELYPLKADDGLYFAIAPEAAPLGGDLDTAESAVLFLSGADPALVEPAMGPHWEGALVAGQTEEGCYDPVAAQAVVQRGGPSGRPADIAEWLVARWMPESRRIQSMETAP